MSLIEDLGGYANSKGVLEAYKKNGWSISDVCKGFHQYFTIEDLEKAILQYRREHNIFEKNDSVVKKSGKHWSQVFKVHNSNEKITTIQAHVLVMFETRFLRHATNEEIKAGRRL